MELQTPAQYRSLIEHSQDIITVVDVDGVIQYSSPAVGEILGYEPATLDGEPASEYFHPDDRQRVAATFGQLAELDSHSEREEYRFRHADGSWVWLETIATNKVDSALQGYVLNSRDITQRKASERELEMVTEQLEVVNRILRHDIRNDMTIITGWVQFLEDHVDEAGQDQLQTLLVSAEHVIELTEVSREFVDSLTSGAMFETEPTPLQPILEKELLLCRAAFPEATFHGPEEVPAVEVVANQMVGAVFRNLLNNAVTHNPGDDPVVEVAVDVGDQAVGIAIGDNGRGIPDGQKQAIFGKGTTTDDSSGTGIGLYLVRTLLDGYDGDITVADNDPTGTVFTVSLPRAA